MGADETVSIENDADEAHSLDRLAWRYRTALELISALSQVTEVRGPLEDIGVPDHMVKEGRWVPVHPRFKDGLCYAAKIAQQALDDSPKPTNSMKSKTKKTARRASGSLDRLVRRWKREAIELRREVAAVNLKLAQDTQYAKSIAVHMARHWSDTAPHWEPFDDIGGILTQIDNMAAGMMRRPPNAALCHPATTRVERTATNRKHYEQES